MSSARPAPAVFAAVDLGSNSFHMIVARSVNGHFHVVDRLRERVAIAEGFDPKKKRLSKKVERRALECLARFRQRLAHHPRRAIRAVGTNTMRELEDRGRFLARAERALGQPIEIVAGKEEGRLIYLGASHSLADDGERRLLVDIGGGSTECVIGERFEPLEIESLQMGCIGWSRWHFASGRITARAFEKAQVAALLELRSLKWRFLQRGWQRAVGSAGTITSIAEICHANGWSDGAITWRGLKRLRDELIDEGRVREDRLAGVTADRVPVLPGGVAILCAVFDALDLDTMAIASGGLREGVLYDLVGRVRHEDVRDRTIRAFSERHLVDVEQASRIERTALRCLDQVADDFELNRDDAHRLLSWAARLHEIGLTIAYSGYHKHGAYIVANADMPGFSRVDQQRLALLVRCHRGRIDKNLFDAWPAAEARKLARLVLLLRLAVRLNRSRSPAPLPKFSLDVRRGNLRLSMPARFFREHPLTRADLDAEAESLGPLGVKFETR